MDYTGTISVIGGGLTGLACALRLAEAGQTVDLHEAAPMAGGRCRSWFDAELGAVIDNGTHVAVGGNHALLAYATKIGSLALIRPQPSLCLPMLDLTTGRRCDASLWSLLPEIIASRWRLQGGSVADCLGRSGLYRSVWEPLTLAIFNCLPALVPARHLAEVLRRTLWKGPAASRMLTFPQGLSATLIDPALQRLRDLGVRLRLSHPLRAITPDRLCFDDGETRLRPEDKVILALPWHQARRLLPNLPERSARAIVNAHFRPPPETLKAMPPGGVMGLLGGEAQWIFSQNGLISATVSAADHLLPLPSAEIAARLWRDCRQALGGSGDYRTVRVLKERRATCEPLPQGEEMMVNSQLILAGDWLSKELPCSLEAAVTAAFRAADLALSPSKG